MASKTKFIIHKQILRGTEETPEAAPLADFSTVGGGSGGLVVVWNRFPIHCRTMFTRLSVVVSDCQWFPLGLLLFPGFVIVSAPV